MLNAIVKSIEESFPKMKNFPFALIRVPLNNLEQALTVSHSENDSHLFKSGVLLASPDLSEELSRKRKSSDKKDLRSQISRDRYWIRSCTRSTPFSTFAGVFAADIEQASTEVTLDHRSGHRMCVRLDMNVLCLLVAKLSKIPEILKQVKYYPNSSIYDHTGNTYRYIEYSETDKGRAYNLTAVHKQDYLQKILSLSEKGLTLGQLAYMLQAFEEVELKEAEIYVEQLIESQILVSEIDPIVTGGDPLGKLLNVLSKFSDIGDHVKSITKLKHLLDKTDLSEISILKIKDSINELLDVEYGVIKDYLQVDMLNAPSRACLSQKDMSTIVQQATELMVLSREFDSSLLKKFKEDFHKRYGDACIPLNAALDPDTGIGYAATDTATQIGLKFRPGAYKETTAIPAPLKLDLVAKFVIEKYIQFLKDGGNEIVITDNDILRLKKQTDKRKFASSMYLMGNLLEKKNGTGDPGFKFNLSLFGGPSAANLLGRFALHDKRIRTISHEITEKEESSDPDVIYAEIVHLPQARQGNVILRPAFRKYEIPYLGQSGVCRENQIELKDLYVCIEGDEVILLSSKLQKRVIPRLSCAHNFRIDSLPMYRFLCDLQYQGLSYPNVWDWSILAEKQFLPRVIYKDIIVRRAQWIIDPRLITENTTKKDLTTSVVINILKKFNLPTEFCIVEGDNELYINTSTDCGLRLLSDELTKKRRVVIKEWIYQDSSSYVRDMEGRPHANEIVIPVFDENVKVRRQNINHLFQNTRAHFFTSSTWLYFKVYCSVAKAQELLSNVIKVFVTEGIHSGSFEKFFFIRYADPEPHLRLRFFNTNIELQTTVAKNLLAKLEPFYADGSIANVVIDTYNRETRRYNSLLIEEAVTGK